MMTMVMAIVVTKDADDDGDDDDDGWGQWCVVLVPGGDSLWRRRV